MKFYLTEKQCVQLKDKWNPSNDTVAYKALVSKVDGDKYTLKDISGKSTVTVNLSGEELPTGVGVGSKVCINDSGDGKFYISRMYKAPKVKTESAKAPRQTSSSGKTPFEKVDFY